MYPSVKPIDSAIIYGSIIKLRFREKLYQTSHTAIKNFLHVRHVLNFLQASYQDDPFGEAGRPQTSHHEAIPNSHRPFQEHPASSILDNMEEAAGSPVLSISKTACHRERDDLLNTLHHCR